MTIQEKNLINALKVITLTPHIRKYLAENDPMALRQAEAAILEVERPLEMHEFRPSLFNPGTCGKCGKVKEWRAHDGL